jgi:hypothetical protein
MDDTTRGRRRALRDGAILGALLVAGCGGRANEGAAGATPAPDGTVEMQLVQAAYIGSATHGSGTLTHRRRTHHFSITGAGIGGIGASTVTARGEVYNLRHIADFPGTYGQARAGFALGAASAGALWLENAAGVVMRLDAQRSGLMLSLGGDAIIVTMR